jgi:DnaJ homolog subfamily C member 19
LNGSVEALVHDKINTAPHLFASFLSKNTRNSAMRSSSAVQSLLKRNGVGQRFRQANQNKSGASFATSQFHTSTFHRREGEDDREQQRLKGIYQVGSRNFSTTLALHYQASQPSESAALVLGLGAVSAACFAGASAISAYNQWKEQQPEALPDALPDGTENKEQFKDEAEHQQTKEPKKEEPLGARENIFSKWFDVGSKYYEGGFEDTMTKREAALILGVRESSSAQRIKEAHRKIMILNHPDSGGSTYMSGKINEAKELLLKGKDRKAKD